MRSFYLKIFFIVCLFRSVLAFSQTDPTGRSYTALMRTSCKKAVNGGCTIKSYCTLKFEKDTVAISYFEKRYCMPKAAGDPDEVIVRQGMAAYPWSVQDTKIAIKNFSDFGGLYVAGKNIILGTQEDYGKLKGLTFTVSAE